jgi:thiamine-phosphate pyrophosphorylase
MAEGCRFYYITNRNAFPGDEFAKRRRLLEKIADAARAGVDYIQLREKDLATRDLENLAREARQTLERVSREIPTTRQSSRLLINSRTDVALAVGADGVHLRADDIGVREVRDAVGEFFSRSSEAGERGFLIGASCHAVDEIREAAQQGADFAVLAPIFEKKDAPQAATAGLEVLREACRGKLPVFALGGVALDNARACLNAGATGIAAIRLFQENRIAEVVQRLRAE